MVSLVDVTHGRKGHAPMCELDVLGSPERPQSSLCLH